MATEDLLILFLSTVDLRVQDHGLPCRSAATAKSLYQFRVNRSYSFGRAGTRCGLDGSVFPRRRGKPPECGLNFGRMARVPRQRGQRTLFGCTGLQGRALVVFHAGTRPGPPDPDFAGH